MIFYIMGKSSSGKDTIFKRLLADDNLRLQQMVPYTTRPIRVGEQSGEEYYFVTEEEMLQMEQDGRVIERRSYDTVHGVWHYFTAKPEDMDMSKHYILIGTVESYCKVRDYFGEDKVEPIYIYVEDGVRLQRALDREKTQSNPKYEEMCRRFLADAVDFSQEKLDAANIVKKYENTELDQCITQLKKVINSFT